MFAKLGASLNLQQSIAPAIRYLQRPLHLFRTYDQYNLRPDILAGLTVAVILLPQSIAFTLVAELPPQMGLYAAILGAIVGALWGSSDQMHTEYSQCHLAAHRQFVNGRCGSRHPGIRHRCGHDGRHGRRVPIGDGSGAAGHVGELCLPLGHCGLC